MCGGSSSSNTSQTNSFVDQSTTNTTTTNVTDNRNFSDNRNIETTDNSVDKRAVLNESTQLMDSMLIQIGTDDEVMKSQILAWDRKATELLEARKFDSQEANRLLSEIMTAANAGTVALNKTQIEQIRGWQNQIQAGVDFAQASLSAGERLIESAGNRQRTITERVFDLASGAMGGTTAGQIKLVTFTLAGVAVILLASNRGRT